jgi:hypothetical protein
MLRGVAPSRRSQPYRKHTGRKGGLALSAMLKGRPQVGINPADVTRMAQRKARDRKRLRHKLRANGR